MSGTDTKRPPSSADEVVISLGLDALTTDDALPVVEPEPQPEVLLFDRTDTGNGARLVHWFGPDLRFCSPLGGWHLWNGVVFKQDELGTVRQKAVETACRVTREADIVLAQAKQESDDDKRKGLEEDAKALLAWSLRSQNTRLLDNMQREASTRSEVARFVNDFNGEHLLLPVRNGVVDLATGNLLPGQRESHFTKQVPIAYNGTATCPTWHGFLATTFRGDSDLISWLQKLLGYCLTGSTEEQSLFLWYGTGANGKSTLLDVLLEILGPFGQTAAPGLLLQRSNEAHPTGMADLCGARLAVGSEVNHDHHFDEAMVKHLTGSDRVKARKLHRDHFEFVPTHKLVLAVNHLPGISGTDVGIWRRLVVVPFAHQVPESERDPKLPQKLRDEAQGILAWAIAGAKRWLEDGLGSCAAIDAAKAKYVEEANVLVQFLDDEVDLAPHSSVAKADLYERFRSWCATNGRTTWSQNTFTRRCSDHGLEGGRTAQGRFWRGLRLRRESK